MRTWNRGQTLCHSSAFVRKWRGHYQKMSHWRKWGTFLTRNYPCHRCVQFTAKPYNLKYKLVDQGNPFSIVIRGLHDSFDELGFPMKSFIMWKSTIKKVFIFFWRHSKIGRFRLGIFLTISSSWAWLVMIPNGYSGSSIDFVVHMKSGIIRRPMLSTCTRRTLMQYLFLMGILPFWRQLTPRTSPLQIKPWTSSFSWGRGVKSNTVG